jgi:hypothetical protein
MKIEAGKTYQTKNGDTVRILLTDANNKTFPVVGLINYGEGERPMVWTSEGTFHAYGTSNYDLVEPPLEVWCIVYKDGVGRVCYDSKKDAEVWANPASPSFVGVFKFIQVKE